MNGLAPFGRPIHFFHVEVGSARQCQPGRRVPGMVPVQGIASRKPRRPQAPTSRGPTPGRRAAGSSPRDPTANQQLQTTPRPLSLPLPARESAHHPRPPPAAPPPAPRPGTTGPPEAGSRRPRRCRRWSRRPRRCREREPPPPADSHHPADRPAQAQQPVGAATDGGSTSPRNHKSFWCRRSSILFIHGRASRRRVEPALPGHRPNSRIQSRGRCDAARIEGLQGRPEDCGDIRQVTKVAGDEFVGLASAANHQLQTQQAGKLLRHDRKARAGHLRVRSETGNPSLTGRKGWGPGTVALSSGKYDGSAAVQIKVYGGSTEGQNFSICNLSTETTKAYRPTRRPLSLRSSRANADAGRS
jgi:hypothetical protein